MIHRNHLMSYIRYTYIVVNKTLTISLRKFITDNLSQLISYAGSIKQKNHRIRHMQYKWKYCTTFGNILGPEPCYWNHTPCTYIRKTKQAHLVPNETEDGWYPGTWWCLWYDSAFRQRCGHQLKKFWKMWALAS